jgi:hypothetical protein
MPRLITDDLMETIAAYGSPEQVAGEIVQRFGDCDRISAYFPGYDPSDDLLADFVAAMKAASSSANA